MTLSSVSKFSMALLGSGIGFLCFAIDGVAIASSSQTNTTTDATIEEVTNTEDDAIDGVVPATEPSTVPHTTPETPVSENADAPVPQTTVSQGPIQVTAPQPSINVGPAQVTIPGLPGTTPEPAVQSPQPTVPQPTIPQAQPTVPRPSIPNPTAQPTIPQPTIPQPTIPQPTIPNPTVISPSTPQPAVGQPNLNQPTLPNPYGVTVPGYPQQPGYPPTAYPQPGYPQSTYPHPSGTPPIAYPSYPQGVGGTTPGYPHGVATPSNTQVISPQPTVINLGGPHGTTPSTLPAANPTQAGADGAVQLVCSAPGYGAYGAPGYPAGYGVPTGVPYGVPTGVPYGVPGYPTAPAPGYPTPGATLPGTQFIGNTENAGSSSDLSGWAASLLAVANPQVGVDLGGVEVDVPIPVGAIAGSLLNGQSGPETTATQGSTVVTPAPGQPSADYPAGYGYPTYPGYPAAPTATYPGYPTYPIAYPTNGIPTTTPGTTQVITSHPTVINVGGAAAEQPQVNGAMLPVATNQAPVPATGGVQMICNPGTAAPVSYPVPQTVAQPTQPVAQETEEQSSGGGFLGGIRPSVGVDVGPFNVGIPLPF